MPKVARRAENKTELMAFRITPRNRFGIELICRTHGLTQTAAIAYALRQLLENPRHGLTTEDGPVALKEVQARAYSPDPVQRFLTLAQEYPELLDETEMAVWKVISKQHRKYQDKGGEWNLDAVRHAMDTQGV